MMLSLILVEDTVSSSEAVWTFMVYLDGDNNLEAAAIADFLEMSMEEWLAEIVNIRIDEIAREQAEAIIREG